MAVTDLSPNSRGNQRIERFLAEQRQQEIVVDRGEFLTTREEDGIVIATVTADHLGPITTPDSPGSRFRFAAFELAVECAQNGKPLILDLSGVRAINMESVFTLLDINDLYQTKNLGFVLSGVNQSPKEMLQRSGSAWGVSQAKQSIAETPEQAIALLKSKRED